MKLHSIHDGREAFTKGELPKDALPLHVLIDDTGEVGPDLDVPGAQGLRSPQEVCPGLVGRSARRTGGQEPPLEELELQDA